MGMYIQAHLLLVALAILEFAAVLAMKRNQCFLYKSDNPQAMILPDHEHLYCQIDRVALCLYLLIFIIFNCIFWPIYS